VVEADSPGGPADCSQTSASVLAKSNATLEAICDGLTDMKDFELHQMPSESLPRLHTMPDPSVQRMKASL
jgi:hypothetical protein